MLAFLFQVNLNETFTELIFSKQTVSHLELELGLSFEYSAAPYAFCPMHSSLAQALVSVLTIPCVAGAGSQAGGEGCLLSDFSFQNFC